MLCSISCNHRHRVLSEDNSYCLNHDSIIDLEEKDILSPSLISVISQGLLIGSDNRDSCSISIIAENTVAKGIEYGEGPSEIFELSSIRKGMDNVQIYDSRKGIISLLMVSGNSISMINVIDGIRLLDDAALINDSVILSVHVDKPYSYALYSTAGNKIDTLTYFPPSPKGIKPFTQSLNNTGSLDIMYPKKIFARSTVFDGGVDFFSFENNSLKHIFRHCIFDKSYTTGTDGISPSPTEDSRVGYTSIKTSDKLFYASFSNDRVFENPEGITNKIHVFSPTGCLLAQYILDCKFSEFAVSKDDTRIYALVDSDKTKIAVFNIIPDVLCDLSGYFDEKNSL